MTHRNGSRFGRCRRWVEERTFLFLTLALLLILVYTPLASGRLAKLVLVELSFAVVLGVGLSAAGYRRLYLAMLFGLWVVSTGLDAVAYALGGLRAQAWLNVLNDISSLVFLVGCTVLLLRRVFQTRRVTTNSVFAATSAYLLLALVWAMVYSLVSHVDPQAFAQSRSTLADTRQDMVYFSLVTITTLGYGDLAPVAPFARMLAAVEAVTGQLYLTVLVAWLVGLSLGHRRASQGRDVGDAPAKENDGLGKGTGGW